MYQMPTRLENGNILKLPNTKNWSIQGHSKAGERTGFWLEPLKIVLDAGLSTYRSPKAIFITHSHTDHSTHIPDIYTTRTKPLKGQEHLIGRPLILPTYITPLVGKMLESIVDLANGELDYCQKYNKDVWETQATHPIEIEIGKKYEIPGINNIQIEILQGYHDVLSVGYGFSMITNKLKEEYKGKNGKEIVELRKNNIEITEKHIIPQIVFYGDTTIDALTKHNEWKKYPVIIIECTLFLEKTNNGQDEKHINWNEIKEIIKNNQSNYFVLIHTSMSVDNDYLTDLENKEIFNNFIFYK